MLALWDTTGFTALWLAIPINRGSIGSTVASATWSESHQQAYRLRFLETLKHRITPLALRRQAPHMVTWTGFGGSKANWGCRGEDLGETKRTLPSHIG